MLHQVLIKIFVNHAPSMSNEMTLLLYIIALFSLCSVAFLFVEKPLRSWIVKRINRFNRRASQSQYKTVLIVLCIIAILFPIVTSKDFTEFKLLAGTAIFDHEDLKIVKSNELLFFVLKSDKLKVTDESIYFFLHVVPANIKDLPENRVIHGFDNFDFFLKAAPVIPTRFYNPYAGHTIVVRKLPTYLIQTIRVGQVNPVSGQVQWRAEIK